jgi:hypothetical protein
MKIDLCFSGHVRNAELTEVTVVATGETINVETSTATEIQEKLQSGEWSVSLSQLLDEGGGDQEVELFDYEVD